jgi:hypothetical protein
MSKVIDLNKTDCLTFFGKVNASISHELKNILAVISETAGLLSDLTEAAKRGRTLEPEMLSSCSEAIVEEVQRGFSTIKQMNKFAHSVDDPIQQVDVAEIVELMINLSKFLSFASKIRFNRADGQGIAVLTSQFLLQDLVYKTILFAFESIGPEKEFGITIKPSEAGGGTIEFSGLGSIEERTSEKEKIEEAAKLIEAEIFFKSDSGAIEIFVPATLGNK